MLKKIGMYILAGVGVVALVFIATVIYLNATMNREVPAYQGYSDQQPAISVAEPAPSEPNVFVVDDPARNQVSAWTNKITIAGYKNGPQPRPGKTFAQIQADIQADSFFKNWWEKTPLTKEAYQRAALIELRYMPQTVINLDNTEDVDGDGQAEDLLLLNGFMVNHCCTSAEVLKGDNAIFFFDQGGIMDGIKATEDHKGFYLNWRNEELMPAACCSIGHVQTQFNWDGNKFVPVRERTIRYAPSPQ